MESARPRAEERLCGPRAGQLHFAIWHICHPSATTRLSSSQRAPISDVKFLLRRNAIRFCVKSGNARPITMAGGWATTFSCPITCICLHDRKSAHDVWRIGCRCGKALALGRSRQRSLSIHRSGKRIISIDIFDPVKIMPRNDITLNKTQCGLGWSRQLSHGRIAGR